MNLLDYRCVFDVLGDPLAVLARKSPSSFEIIAVNEAWERLFGRPRAHHLGQPIGCVFSSPVATDLAAACERCIAADAAIELEVQVPNAQQEGSQTWRLSPLPFDAVAPQVVLTVRPAHSEAEWQSTLNLRNILEQTSDYIIHYDHKGRILFYNQALQQFFGVGESGALGKTDAELWPGVPQAEQTHALVLDVIHSGTARVAEFLIEPPGAEPRWHQVRYAPERNAQGEVVSVLGIGRDITALKVAEEKVRQSEQQFRTLAEHSPDLIFRFDRELRLLYANPAVARCAGKPVGAYVGRKAGDNPESTHFQVTSGAASMRDALQRVLRDNEPFEFEAREYKPNVRGGFTHSSYVVVPERDTHNQVQSVLAIGRDVTHLKAIEAELRVLNATLEDRVAARTMDLEVANRDLRSFAHTISHDLRTPLRAIIGFATLLTEDEGDRLSEHGRALLERVCNAGHKLSRLIDDILQYSHAAQAALTRHPVSLTQLAQEVTGELLVQYPNASVKVHDVPNVSGDPTMLRQVVQNLIGNALKFSSRQAHAHVEVNCERRDRELVFYVRDNGAGFDMSYADKLGSLFKRLHTEREYPGSGVGLAIVQRLIERHGGRLWAQSEPGAGATFYFTVPCAPTEVQAEEH